MSAQEAVAAVRKMIQKFPGEILETEAETLYDIAAAYNRPGARFLEIGCGHGFSAAVLALAAPDAEITTITPAFNHFCWSREGLKRFPNVTVRQLSSAELLQRWSGECELIFIDGDHQHFDQDIPWFDRVAVGGAFVCHDVDFPRVGLVVAKLSEHLGRGPEVQTNTLVAFYRREGEGTL